MKPLSEGSKNPLKDFAYVLDQTYYPGLVWEVCCILYRVLEVSRARIEALEKRRVEDFVAGAKWWEYDRENATMWQSDQERAAAAAEVHFKAQALREAALAAKEKP